MQKNDIEIKGFIDNDESRWSEESFIYSKSILQSSDVIILASQYYPEIIEQLEDMGIKNHIYYEQLALLAEELETYSSTFEDIFGELEINKEHYAQILDLLTDNLSKEIYANIVLYRNTLDISYTQKAFELSLKEGKQDFDRIVVDRLDEEYTFYDVGGFDGESTVDYITHIGNYNKIYFFEPDKLIIKNAMSKLCDKENIVFVEAGVGEKRGTNSFTSTGKGDDTFLGEGEEIEIVALDDFVDSHKSYIKMDIEGYEMSALIGAKQCIKRYKPMLSISVYHLPGDIYRIIQLVLSWNPGYRIYMRHYNNSCADTRVYFIDDNECDGV